MDASNVDMDTEAGWVRFSLQDPVQLDLLAVADVLESASYELLTIQIELSGEVVEDSGKRWLVVDQTGQRIPIDAKSATADARVVRAVVVGWKTNSPRLSLTQTTGS